MPKFNKRVFGAPVDSEIIKEFQKLEGGVEGDILGEVKPTFKKYLGDRTPFTRMWCAVNLRISGSEDKDSETLVFSVNENREDSYTKNPLDTVESSKKTGNIRYVSQLSEELGGGNPYMMR